MEDYEKIFFVVVVSLISFSICLFALDRLDKETFVVRGEVVDIQYVGSYSQVKTIIRLKGGEVVVHNEILGGVEIGYSYSFLFRVNYLDQEKLVGFWRWD